MKFSKKTIITVSILILVIPLLECGLRYFALKTFMGAKFRRENIAGIGIALVVYARDYDTIPDLDKWCDELTVECDMNPLAFLGFVNPEEDICGYALNSNLEGVKFSDLDDDVVLAFEAKGPWNLSGGLELAKKTKQKKSE